MAVVVDGKNSFTERKGGVSGRGREGGGEIRERERKEIKRKEREKRKREKEKRERKEIREKRVKYCQLPPATGVFHPQNTRDFTPVPPDFGPFMLPYIAS